MENTIDCFLIGNYELKTEDQIILERIYGKKNSIKSKELNLSFVRYNNNIYTPEELFNKIFYDENDYQDDIGPIKVDNTISNTITYLYNYLSKRGFAVDYINEFTAHRNELSQKLIQNQIRCVAISSTFIVEPYPIIEMVKFIRKYNSEVKIVIGGPFIYTALKTIEETELQEYLRQMGADIYLCTPEGEATLSELLKAFINNFEYKNINNIYYRNGNEYIFTAYIAENNDFEEGIVDWSLFLDKNIDLLHVQTSKSCLFSCSFCTYPILAGPFKSAKVELVEKMLSDINDVGSVSYITFIDDTLNIPVDRFKEMLRMMIKNKFKFKWSGFFRCQYADRELVEMMKESGCESVFLGIESGSQQILDNLNKKVKVEQYYNGLSLLNEYGIHSYASFIIGFPGETYDTFLETKRFIEEARPTFYTTHNWMNVLLAPINEQKERYNLQGINYDWSHSTMNSQTASELIYELVLSVNNSIFAKSALESTFMLQLLRRGLSLDQIKMFFHNYNIALKDKILNPHSKGISEDIATRLREICRKQN